MMRANAIRLSAILSGLVFIIIVIGNVVIVAQNEVNGTWKADSNRQVKDDDGDSKEIQLNFSRSGRRGNSMFGGGYNYNELQGLSRDQTQDGKVRFSLVREAGTVECEGTFADGRGSGTFRFSPSEAYLDGMRSRGFDFSKVKAGSDTTPEERALTAALLNVTTSLADDLLSANFGRLDIDDLFKAAIFKIDGKYMAEMKATGFPDLSMEDLVKARIFKIDAAYVRQIHEMGFDDRDFESLVKFRIFNVTPEFLSEVKAAGLSDLKSEDIVKCRIFKIDAEFVRRAKAADPSVTIEDLVKMKIGVYRKRDSI